MGLAARVFGETRALALVVMLLAPATATADEGSREDHERSRGWCVGAIVSRQPDSGAALARSEACVGNQAKDSTTPIWGISHEKRSAGTGCGCQFHGGGDFMHIQDRPG